MSSNIETIFFSKKQAYSIDPRADSYKIWITCVNAHINEVVHDEHSSYDISPYQLCHGSHLSLVHVNIFATTNRRQDKHDDDDCYYSNEYEHYDHDDEDDNIDEYYDDDDDNIDDDDDYNIDDDEAEVD